VSADAAAPPPFAELAELARSLAREAGLLLLERYETGLSVGVHSKSTPTDLVSEADLASERLLRERIRDARPRDGVLGEEGEHIQGSSGLRWVVDPLDGTVNFLFGIPQWSVSVAVQEVDSDDTAALFGARTLAGAIFDPARGEMWSATADGEALLDGAPIAGSGRAELSTAMLATGLAYDAAVRAEQAKVLAALIPRVRDIRRLGSAALDLAWTAAGRYDAYFERSVKLWDVAAGVLICERAGVAVRELAPRAGLPAGVLAASAGIVEGLDALVR
jgi:myo-inositol-1(or 4)-monophosphatase